MNMLHIISNGLFVQLCGSATNDDIAGRAVGYFVCDVAGKHELSVSPANFDLRVCQPGQNNIVIAGWLTRF